MINHSYSNYEIFGNELNILITELSAENTNKAIVGATNCNKVRK